MMHGPTNIKKLPVCMKRLKGMLGNLNNRNLLSKLLNHGGVNPAQNLRACLLKK